MKKRYAISALMVLFLLIVSQIIWIRQVAERDQSRFREEVNTLINDIVKHQATRQTYELFEMDTESPSITIQKINPDSVSADAKSYGNYETESYNENASLASFLEAVLIEKLLEKNRLDLHIIDSLFQNNFSHASQLSSYSFVTQEKDNTLDSLYFGINAVQQLNDTTKGVYITIPLGTSGNYRFVSHFIFRPTTATQRMTMLVIISAVAIVAVAIIFFVLLYQLQRQMNRFHFQEKRVRGIVHDLKSPLAYIYSLLSILEMNNKSNTLTEGKSRVKRMSNNIERMLSEVKLNEKKSAALQRESYDLALHFRKLSNDLQVIHKEKEITTTFNIAPEACVVYVDPFYFECCLRNLLDNAIKYSDNTPVITVTTRKERNNIVIAIADQGEGIPKREQRRIFRDFHRSLRESSVEGHGIGLSSVQHIVKVHGGKITLESQEGEGTVFTIFLFQNNKVKNGTD